MDSFAGIIPGAIAVVCALLGSSLAAQFCKNKLLECEFENLHAKRCWVEWFQDGDDRHASADTAEYNVPILCLIFLTGAIFGGFLTAIIMKYRRSTLEINLVTPDESDQKVEGNWEGKGKGIEDDELQQKMMEYSDMSSADDAGSNSERVRGGTLFHPLPSHHRSDDSQKMTLFTRRKRTPIGSTFGLHEIGTPPRWHSRAVPEPHEELDISSDREYSHDTALLLDEDIQIFPPDLRIANLRSINNNFFGFITRLSSGNGAQQVPEGTEASENSVVNYLREGSVNPGLYGARFLDVIEIDDEGGSGMEIENNIDEDGDTGDILLESSIDLRAQYHLDSNEDEDVLDQVVPGSSVVREPESSQAGRSNITGNEITEVVPHRPTAD